MTIDIRQPLLPLEGFVAEGLRWDRLYTLNERIEKRMRQEIAIRRSGFNVVDPEDKTQIHYRSGVARATLRMEPGMHSWSYNGFGYMGSGCLGWSA